MKKTYDLSVVIDKYNIDCEEKYRYKKIGVLVEEDNKKYLLLDRHISLAGIPDFSGKKNSSVLVSCFEKKTKEV